MARSEDEASDDDGERESSDSLLREVARIDASSLNAVPVHRAPGSRIGRFILRGELGRGGMGVVYRAHDDALGRSVALKVLPVLGGARADEAKARLLREARAAASLEHPHVVAIHEVGEDHGAPFIAMELVVGQTLRERMRDPSTLEEKIGWLSDVADALGAAHDKGIVHRDIKPENVMIRRDGRVKVLDFGIARQAATPIDPSAPTATSDAELGTITEEGARVGTPRYMSPEQLKGEKLDGRCDQFAWGVVAYELFSGRPPWVASDAVSLIASILGKEPPRLAEVAPEAPRALTAVVARALAKSRGDRFASMHDVVAALESPSTAPTREARLRTPMRRITTIGAGLSAVFLAAALIARALGAFGEPADRAGLAVTHLAAPSNTKGVSVTDLPPPKSSNATALAAYAAGLQSWRDGRSLNAYAHFIEASKLDPTMGAAFLRAWMMDVQEEGGPSNALFTSALALRGTMNDHEALLLDASAVCLHHAGDAVCDEKYADLARRYPLDAEFALDAPAQGFREALAASDRALALDPHFGPALAARVVNLAYLGELDEASREAARCAEITQNEDCLQIRAWIEIQDGRCGAYEMTAREILRMEPDSATGLWDLGFAQFELGKPIEGLRATLERDYEMDPEGPLRTYHRAQFDWSYALAAADFEAALGVVQRRVKAQGNERSLKWLSEPYLKIMQFDLEMGRPEDAGKTAREFLARRDSLQEAPTVTDQAISDPLDGELLFTLQKAQLIDKKEYRKRREELVATWEPRVKPQYRPFLWLELYAASSVDAEDARDALDALPRFGPIPKWFGFVMYGAMIDVGRVYLLAGKLDEAIPWLERASKLCIRPRSILSTQALALLGQALEANRDQRGACDAYRKVIDRWGHAKPRSVTADEAKKRSKALGCAR